MTNYANSFLGKMKKKKKKWIQKWIKIERFLRCVPPCNKTFSHHLERQFENSFGSWYLMLLCNRIYTFWLCSIIGFVVHTFVCDLVWKTSRDPVRLCEPILGPRLLVLFKQQFLLFKQHNMYFHTYVFS